MARNNINLIESAYITLSERKLITDYATHTGEDPQVFIRKAQKLLRIPRDELFRKMRLTLMRANKFDRTRYEIEEIGGLF